MPDIDKRFISLFFSQVGFAPFLVTEILGSIFLNHYFIMKLRMVVSVIFRCAMNWDKSYCSHTLDSTTFHFDIRVERIFLSLFLFCFENTALHIWWITLFSFIALPIGVPTLTPQ